MSQVVVLGMHRSGTSMVAGIIARLGVSMGSKLVGPAKSNPLGHMEDTSFVYANQKIIEACGGAWDHVPPRKMLNSVIGAEPLIKDMIARRDARYLIWGWKDPRTILTIDHYLPYLSDPIFVAVFRKRESVVKSLLIRDAHQTAEVAGYLYDEYNERLADFLEGREYVGIEYEGVLDAPETSVKMLASCLGVPATDEAIGFVHPELNHGE